MQLTRAKKIVTRRGEEKHFTGTVWLNEMLNSILEFPGVQESNDVKVYLVYFEPGARTVWHRHPAGQVLYVVAGNGRVKRVGSGDQEQHGEIHTGDVIYIAPNEKHWHGAGPNSSMVHLAINFVSPGKQTDWMEKVTDTDYDSGFD